jgi:hypothetical protein
MAAQPADSSDVWSAMTRALLATHDPHVEAIPAIAPFHEVTGAVQRPATAQYAFGLERDEPHLGIGQRARYDRFLMQYTREDTRRRRCIDRFGREQTGRSAIHCARIDADLPSDFANLGKRESFLLARDLFRL